MKVLHTKLKEESEPPKRGEKVQIVVTEHFMAENFALGNHEYFQEEGFSFNVVAARIIVCSSWMR